MAEWFSFGADVFIHGPDPRNAVLNSLMSTRTYRSLIDVQYLKSFRCHRSPKKAIRRLCAWYVLLVPVHISLCNTLLPFWMQLIITEAWV